MKTPAKMSRTAIMVEGSLMVGLAFILSFIKPLPLPFGGSVTIFSTLPILIMSFRHCVKWGVGTALVYSFLQMLQGMENVMFHKTIFPMVLCILLDYVLAYTCIGFAGTVAKITAAARKSTVSTFDLAAAVLITGLGRYICSFLSGIILYRQYADGNVVSYSLKYNALWCWPDVLLVMFAVIALANIKALHLKPVKSAGS